MLIFLLLLLLLWYSHRERSPLTSRGLKSRTEIHAPVLRDRSATSGSLDYRRAADEMHARNLLVQVETEFDSGCITAEEFHSKAAPLVSRIDFRWLGGPERGLAE